MPSSPSAQTLKDPLYVGLAWCLAWGPNNQPSNLPALQKLRKKLLKSKPVPNFSAECLTAVSQLQSIPDSYFPDTLAQLQQDYPTLWDFPHSVGLVYGGATKIKQYVFESGKLQDIRGASALLDRINLVDLPAFFQVNSDKQSPQYKKEQSYGVEQWLTDSGFAELAEALIPQLIVYASGGNILAFCPAPFVEDLANAIERRYTEETLIANACAVGDRFRLLELRFGKLPAQNKPPFWLQDYKAQAQQNPILQAYFDQTISPNDHRISNQFKERKTFSELVTQLASQFNQRRGGYDGAHSDRPSRCFPPLYETHPYLARDENDRRPAIGRVSGLRNTRFSEPAGRKYVMGQKAKRQTPQSWWPEIVGNWQSGEVDSWVQKFLNARKKLSSSQYFAKLPVDLDKVDEARSLREIGAACNRKGFVAYIYADGNNIGSYIQKNIKTPEAYQRFSEKISEATEQAVYRAIAQHLQPVHYQPDDKSDRKRPSWIHPFEILTIGGDDVFLVVPADKALAIAHSLATEFESHLLTHYPTPPNFEADEIHRYRPFPPQPDSQCELSMSIGVLIAAENTPIYYAQALVEQLLKSAKQKAKTLTKSGYRGGTVDFLILKAVTAISSNLAEFREKGLTKSHSGKAKLKLYGAPYTLHELSGLIKTAEALSEKKFPASQLYQLRSLLDQGKRTAILNYRYFRVRLKDNAKQVLEDAFETAWCSAKTNGGNLAPWMSLHEPSSTKTDDKTTYETIWRELIDLMSFTGEETSVKKPQSQPQTKTQTRTRPRPQQSRRSRRGR